MKTPLTIRIHPRQDAAMGAPDTFVAVCLEYPETSETPEYTGRNEAEALGALVLGFSCLGNDPLMHHPLDVLVMETPL